MTSSFLIEILMTKLLIFFTICLARNAYCSIYTNPYIVKNKEEELVLKESKNKNTSNNTFENCKKCGVLRDKRSHHCSVCRRCVDKLDHHCFILNNCIGGKNYHYFVSYIFSVTSNALLMTILNGIELYAYKWKVSTVNKYL